MKYFIDPKKRIEIKENLRRRRHEIIQATKDMIIKIDKIKDLSQTMSNQYIANELNVSFRQVVRWRHGETPPRINYFVLLKELANGKLPQQSSDQNLSDLVAERLKGRFDQITAQLTEVQNRVAILENEINLKKKSQAVQSVMKVKK